jgi:hypothetical protein
LGSNDFNIYAQMLPFYPHVEYFLTAIKNRFHHNFLGIAITQNFPDNNLILGNNFGFLIQAVGFHGKMMEYFRLQECLPLN